MRTRDRNGSRVFGSARASADLRWIRWQYKDCEPDYSHGKTLGRHFDLLDDVQATVLFKVFFGQALIELDRFDLLKDM